jgi:hypothetical protein
MSAIFITAGRRVREGSTFQGLPPVLAPRVWFSCFAALVFATFVGAPISADAQVRATSLQRPFSVDLKKRPRRVALLPLKLPATHDSALFAKPGPPPQLIEDIDKHLRAALKSHDFVDFVDPARARQQLTKDAASESARRLAQERYRLGVEYYLSMAFERAADSMERAATIYGDMFQDVLDAKPLADAYLIRGVSLVQSGNLPAAHVALKKMFAVQPNRTFSRRGFYGPAVDLAILRALKDESVTGKHETPYGDASRLTALARQLKLAAIISASVVQRGGEPMLLVSFFRADHRVFAGHLRLAVGDISQPGSGVGPSLDAFISRMLACLPVSALDNKSPARKRKGVWMDTSAVGGAFLRKPTRLQFYSLGFAAGVEQRLRPGFGFFGRINVLTSLPDPFRDLVQSFNSLRAIAGVSFGVKLARLRFFLRPGFELHILGSAVATRDPGCKFFGKEHWTCNATPAVTKSLEQDVLLGVNAALGTQVSIGRGFFINLQGSGAFYFLPLDGTQDLNLPFFGELGLGYEF